MRKTLIINGYPRAGKTLFAKYLAEEIKTIERSSIDLVKEYATKYFDWTGEKTPEYRKFLSDLKCLLSQETDLIKQDLDRFRAEMDKYEDCLLIIDIREKEEIEKYKVLYDAATVFIENDRVTKSWSNASDSLVEQYEYDYYIDNTGDLEHLRQQAKRLVQNLKLD